ncbi:MAG: ECF-type sigma factor [Planctomycetota bacterium]
MANEPQKITSLLRAVSSGATEAWEPLLDLIYRELQMLADKQMRRERRGHTFQRTALVNEAYIRLVGGKPGNWENRAHFFAAAAEAMRRILVEHARQRRVREGELGHISIENALGLDPVSDSPNSCQTSPNALDADTEALDAALSKLEADEDRQDLSTTVKLRYFVGLSIEETAQALGKSVAKVKRDWHFAKAWLYHELKSKR